MTNTLEDSLGRGARFLASSKSRADISRLGLFRTPKDQSIYDWAEENVILPARIPGQYAGPYRVAITPYMRGVFDALRDPRVNVIAVEAGAQTGKTIAAYIALAYWCAAFVSELDDLRRGFLLCNKSLGKRFRSTTRLQAARN